MGLAISQRIVEEHGGALELVSGRPGQTCFVARLPFTLERET
jgi:signal transduction histidine kinase